MEAAATMAPKRKIFLVAVDESKESMHALSWFLNNTLPPPAPSDHPLTLVLLYVKPSPPLYFTPDGYMFSPEVTKSMNEYKNSVAECIMEKAKRVCKEAVNDKVKVETMIERGDARDVICEVVAKLSVDLLVMGSHGYGPIKRAFLGSVSNHCAQNVKCPILIIKTPKIKSNSADASSFPLMSQDPKTIDPRTIDARTIDPRTIDAMTIDPSTIDAMTIDPRATNPMSSTDPRTTDPKTIDPRTTDPW